MRTTGMIRRVDELGRIVLPKEIRRTMSIPDGMPMEILIENEQVILRKYVPEEEVLEKLNMLEKQLELESEDMDLHKVKVIKKQISDIRAILNGEE